MARPEGTPTGTGRRAPRAAKRANSATPQPEEAAERRYHHGNLREELIRCGKLRLRTEGLVDLSLRRIAADAGVSQVAPMHHFGNKEGLLAAIAASGFRDLTEFRFSRVRPGMSAEQRLRILLSSYVVFATQNPALFHLMFAPEFKTPELHLELNEVASQSYHLLVRAATQYLEETGETDGATGDDIARVAWMSMHGLATLAVENRINPLGAPKYTMDQLTKLLLDWVFAGAHAMRGQPRR